MFDIHLSQPLVCSIYILYYSEKKRRGVSAPEIVITYHSLVMKFTVTATALMNSNMVD